MLSLNLKGIADPAQCNSNRQNPPIQQSWCNCDILSDLECPKPVQHSVFWTDWAWRRSKGSGGRGALNHLMTPLFVEQPLVLPRSAQKQVQYAGKGVFIMEDMLRFRCSLVHVQWCIGMCRRRKNLEKMRKFRFIILTITTEPHWNGKKIKNKLLNHSLLQNNILVWFSLLYECFYTYWYITVAKSTWIGAFLPL